MNITLNADLGKLASMLGKIDPQYVAPDNYGYCPADAEERLYLRAAVALGLAYEDFHVPDEFHITENGREFLRTWTTACT